MAVGPNSNVIEFLRHIVRRDDAKLADEELLSSFVEKRDESAFESLVGRHGRMVWSVCRRLLSSELDAEDAFQATFIVLVRKAGSIVPRGMVANWLYGVAYQTALQARRTAARRGQREKQFGAVPEPAAVSSPEWHDLQPLLDRELSRLPGIYRAVLLLCDLEGKTRQEAARQLGCPEGTVAGRLPRARAMLAKRLRGRGLVLSNATLAAVLAENASSAGLPGSLMSSTLNAVGSIAGQAATGSLISANAFALSRGVLNAMFLTKIKLITTGLLLAAAATGGFFTYAGLGAGQPSAAGAGRGPTPSAPKDGETDRAKAALDQAQGEMDKARADWELAKAQFGLVNRKAATAKFVQEMRRALEQLSDKTNDKQKTLEALDTIDKLLQGVKQQVANDGAKPGQASPGADGMIWGETVNGLQLGIGLPLGKMDYRIGDQVELVVKLRNMSNIPITYELQSALFGAVRPTVKRIRPREEPGAGGPLGGGGRRGGFTVFMPYELARQSTIEKRIAPGALVEIGRQTLKLVGSRTAVMEMRRDQDNGLSVAPVVPGTYAISYQNVLQVGPSLSTPEVTIEVKAADPDDAQPAGQPLPKNVRTEPKKAEPADPEKAKPKLEDRDPRKQAPAADEFVWGKEVDGLQLGVALQAETKPVMNFGDEVRLILKVRNVSKQAAILTYSSEPLTDLTPQVVDAAGKPVKVEMPIQNFFKRVLREYQLGPGQVFDFGSPTIRLVQEKPVGMVNEPTVWVTPGKYRISYSLVRQKQFMSSGQVEIEVKPDPNRR